MKNAPIYSVTQVNQYIKGLLDRDGALAGLFVRGELSNYKAYPSGHHYFSLKDAEGAIRCVMVPAGGHGPAVPSGKRHEGGGLWPGNGLSKGRAVSALL